MRRRRSSFALGLVLAVSGGCSLPTEFDSPSASAADASPGPGGRLAISCHIQDFAASDMCVMDADGTNLQRLTSGPENEYDADWSPDGRHIVFRSAPSADPERSGPSDIVFVDVETKVLHNVTNHPEWGNWSPAWSPDGEWIAFYSERDHEPGLYLIRPNGVNMHLVLAGDAEFPAWSPDGRELAFMSLGFPPGRTSAAYEVWIVSAVGSDLRQLTQTDGEDGWPTWSPDGQHIAYSHDRGGTAGYEIVMVDVDSRNPVILTDAEDGLSHDYPAWSPDGTHLAWSGYSQTGVDRGGVFVMKLADRTTQAIASDGVSPAWQPQGLGL